jgi:DNA ligase-1
LKRTNSTYQINKRSHDWLKVSNYQYTDAFITGLRKDEFGLLLGIEENNRIKPAGIMEFLVPAARKMFYEQYKYLTIKEDKKFIFLDPNMKCRIKFRNYTKDGKLRIPSFVEYIS